MTLKEIADTIYQRTFGKADVRTAVVYDRIVKKYTELNIIHSRSDFKRDFAEDDKQVLYFKMKEEQFIPLPRIEANNVGFDFSYSIPSISTLNEKITFNKNYYRNLKLVAFLFDYKFTDDELAVVDGKRSDSNLRESHRKEIANIYSAEKRELALSKMVFLLTQEDIYKLTIITNDLHFVLNIITSIICFLDREENNETGERPELYIMFDPASVSDIISFRIFLLKELGATIKLLPIKNKYPYFGIVTNWTPFKPIELAGDFYIFRTFFFERQSGKNYFEHISSQTEVTKMLSKIIESDTGGKDTILPPSKFLEKKDKPSLKPVSIEKYIEYLYASFTNYKTKNMNAEVVYLNVKFTVKEILIDELYYRTKSVLKYKVLQADEFIKKYKGKVFNFYTENDIECVECSPYDLSINKQLFPVNPIFIEYNSDKQRYEVAEGHSRIWALYNYHNVRKIKTIVVENIPKSFFKPIETKLVATGLNYANYDKKYSTDWSDTKLIRSDIDETEILLQPRMIESITHTFPNSVFKKLYDEYIEKGVLEIDDIKYSNKLK